MVLNRVDAFRLSLVSHRLQATSQHRVWEETEFLDVLPSVLVSHGRDPPYADTTTVSRLKPLDDGRSDYCGEVASYPGGVAESDRQGSARSEARQSSLAIDCRYEIHRT